MTSYKVGRWEVMGLKLKSTGFTSFARELLPTNGMEAYGYRNKRNLGNVLRWGGLSRRDLWSVCTGMNLNLRPRYNHHYYPQFSTSASKLQREVLGWKFDAFELKNLRFAICSRGCEKAKTALGLILMFEAILLFSSVAQIARNICNLPVRLHFAENPKHLPIDPPPGRYLQLAKLKFLDAIASPCS